MVCANRHSVCFLVSLDFIIKMCSLSCIGIELSPSFQPPWAKAMWTCFLLYKHTKFTSVSYSLLGVKPTFTTGDYLVLITTLLLLDGSGALHSPANEHQLLRKRRENVSQILQCQTGLNSVIDKMCMTYIYPSYFLLDILEHYFILHYWRSLLF